MYILDEPSIGLHQRDNDRLLKTLLKLRNLGNTVIIVEHDEEAINAFQLVSRMEGFVSPSLEPSHAFAEAIKIAPSLSKDTIIVVDSCGDSAKDSRIIAERLGYKI